MKRMSEVFELPVKKGDGFSCGILYSGQGLPLATFCFEDDAQHAAHAINHVDALADALEMLMDWNVKNVTIEHHPIYDIAHSTLAAYRGGK